MNIFKFFIFQFVFNRLRFYIFCIFISFIFIFLILRIVYLQIYLSDSLMNEGKIRSLRIDEIPVSRGIITDRMGRLLAINVPMNSVWIDPQEIENHGGIDVNLYKWFELSKILSIPISQLSSFIKNHEKKRFLYLSRHVTPILSKRISELQLPGLYLKKESKRFYPTEHVTAHLIGVTDIDNRGIEGIEKSFDHWLTGQSGKKIIRKDCCGRIMENTIISHPQPAKNIVLSIDERLQHVAYRELSRSVNLNKAESGSIVLVDINTGEILAMTNSPSYNPNNLSITNPSMMRNRAVTDIFEPGSTVKPIVIMTALANRIICQDTILNTSPYIIQGYKIRDVNNYDKLTIKEILQKSSNVGVSKLALAMPPSELVRVYSSFGMGKKTNIGLIGESSGIYPYNRRWSDIDRATFSYGYGLMITPLQLAKVYATIGSMGLSRPLSIIKLDSSLPLLNERIFPKSLVQIVINMMEIVSFPNNSNCYSAIDGYRVAVKTGTVKKIDSNGKYINKYVSYTAGIAPVSDPKFALVVVINDPKKGQYYGSIVSAPVFSAVMSSALKIMCVRPDSLPKTYKK